MTAPKGPALDTLRGELREARTHDDTWDRGYWSGLRRGLELAERAAAEEREACAAACDVIADRCAAPDADSRLATSLHGAQAGAWGCAAAIRARGALTPPGEREEAAAETARRDGAGGE